MTTHLTNILSSERGQVWPCIGSFWSNIFSRKDQVAWLLELVRSNRTRSIFDATTNDLAGNYDASRKVAQTLVYFKSTDVFTAGMQLYDDPDNQAEYLLPTNYTLVYNFFRIPYFVIPVKDIIPLSIQSTTGRLVVGVDFFVLNQKYIYFRQDPRLIFPRSAYLVVAGLKVESPAFIDYLTKTTARENSYYVVQYLRKFQTPKYLGLALAAVGGLAILRKGQILKAIQKNPGTNITVYLFETETLRVGYPHVPLIVGNAYPDDYIVGTGVQVFQSSNKNSAWWRQIDWRGGISLDPIIRDFRGLTLLDRTTVAYTAGQDPGSTGGSKVHARVALTDDFFTEEPYWQYVAERETNSGFYLNALLNLPEDVGSSNPNVEDTFAKMLAAITEANIINQRSGFPLEQPALTALPNSVRVNALDLFFQAVLGRTAFIVLFDLNQIEHPEEMFTFLNRELITGGTPIIIAYGPNLQIDIACSSAIVASVAPVIIVTAVVLDLLSTTDLEAATITAVYLQPLSPTNI